MKLRQRLELELEPTEIAEAVSDYLAKMKVNAVVTVEQLLEGLGDDLSFTLETDGEAPKAPVKRRRKSTKKVEPTEEDSEEVPDVDAEAIAKTILQEASEANEKRLAEEAEDEADDTDGMEEEAEEEEVEEPAPKKKVLKKKIKAKRIDDEEEELDEPEVELDEEPAEEEESEEAEAPLETETKPKKKSGIFKKRKKTVE